MFKRIVSGIMALTVMCSFSGCTSIGTNPEDYVSQSKKIGGQTSTESIDENVIDDTTQETFKDVAAQIAFELLKNCDKADGNTLISPTSIMLAVGMTANGGAGGTLEEISDVLGYKLNMDLINILHYNYAKSLPDNEDVKMSIANSVWIKNNPDLQVKEEFLTKCLTYYEAEIYTTDFDRSTVTDVNYWVEENTDGVIDNIIDEFNGDELMMLINAIAFDAEWQSIYYEDQVRDVEFITADGNKNMVDGMYSEEDIYIHDENTEGFIKNYKGGYQFVALLPDENVFIDEYVQNFTAEKYWELMDGQKDAIVNAMLPKFSYEYSTSLKNTLIAMGMEQAFDPNAADFSNMADCSQNIYVGDVIHKTFIEVGEKGTKAAAVTAVIMEGNAMIPVEEEVHEVYLDRPFMYMIIDEITKLPVFVGVVRDI